MAKDMKNHVIVCKRWLHFKQKPQKAELNSIETTHPMELLHIDYLTMESGKLIFWLSWTISLDTLKHFSFHPKQLELELKYCGINSLCIMLSQKPSF